MLTPETGSGGDGYARREAGGPKDHEQHRAQRDRTVAELFHEATEWVRQGMGGEGGQSDRFETRVAAWARDAEHLVARGEEILMEGRTPCAPMAKGRRKSKLPGGGGVLVPPAVQDIGRMAAEVREELKKGATVARGARARKAPSRMTTPYAGPPSGKDTEEERGRGRGAGNAGVRRWTWAVWNFHEMGGLHVGGNETIIEAAFWAAEATMRKANVETCLVPGVRLLGDEKSGPSDFLPAGFPLEYVGIRSTKFDGVGFLNDTVPTRIEPSLTRDRIVVGVIDAANGRPGGLIIIGSYVPHRGHREVREAVFESILTTVREVRQKQAAGWLPNHSIRVAADFNFGARDTDEADDAGRTFIQEMISMGFVAGLPQDVQTHCRGGHLQDVFYPKGAPCRVAVRAQGALSSDHMMVTATEEFDPRKESPAQHTASVQWQGTKEEWAESIRPWLPLIARVNGALWALRHDPAVVAQTTRPVREEVIGQTEWILDAIAVVAGHSSARVRTWSPGRGGGTRPGSKEMERISRRMATVSSQGRGAMEEIKELRRRHSAEADRCVAKARRKEAMEVSEIMGKTTGEVQKWLARKTGGNLQMLGEVLLDDAGKLVSGPEAQSAAIEHIREVRNPEAKDFDMEAIAAAEGDIIQHLMELQATEAERMATDEDDDWSGDEYDAAEKRVRMGAATIEVTHAALHADLQEWRDAQLGLINLARRWEIASPALRRHMILGVLKPGKQPLIMVSYRTIALFHARARIVDELRMMRSEGAMADFVGPAQQGGRSGSVEMLVAKVEAGRVRVNGLKLPLGVMPTDVADGFPTARRYLSLAGWRKAGMTDRDLRGVEEEEAGTRAQVRMGSSVSESFEVVEGLDQGRRRNPPGYSGLVKKLAEAAEGSGPAVGLDPPELAVEAAKRAGIGAATDDPDMEEAERAARACAAVLQAAETAGGVAREGLMEKSDAVAALTVIMASLGGAATRLAVLDILSTTRVGMLQIIDDGCVFRSSPGALRLAAKEIGEGGRKIGQRLRTGAGKTEASWSDPNQEGWDAGASADPDVELVTQGQVVRWVDSFKETGSHVDNRFSGSRAWTVANEATKRRGQSISFLRDRPGVPFAPTCDTGVHTRFGSVAVW